MAKFEVCVQNEALELLAPPPSCSVAFVEKARDFQVVFFLGVLEFVSAQKAAYNAFNHFWRVV